MKASYHCSREGNARHNDRTFLAGLAAQDIAEIAPHIDMGRIGRDQVWTRDGRGWQRVDTETAGSGRIQAAERAFYSKRYGAWQEAKNNRYRKQRHKEKCRSTDALYTSKRTRPEEVILQIGSKEEPVSPKVFHACFMDYMAELSAWNREYGHHMHWLSVALHYDETSPHAHIRRCWDYEGPDGPALGQDKALEAAGVPLPDPHKPKGRYNNRKMEFDRMMREKWLDICEEHGLRLDRNPIPGIRHKDKEEYVRAKIATEIQAARALVEDARQAAGAADAKAEKLKEEIKKREKTLQSLRSKADVAQSRLDRLQAYETVLVAAETVPVPETEVVPFGLLRDKAFVSRRDLERLAQKAAMAEAAAHEAAEAAAGRVRLERAATETLSQVKKQARQIVEQARETEREIISQAEQRADAVQAEMSAELKAYRRLERHFPEEMARLRMKEEKRRQRIRKEKEVEDYSR